MRPSRSKPSGNHEFVKVHKLHEGEHDLAQIPGADGIDLDCFALDMQPEEHHRAGKPRNLRNYRQTSRRGLDRHHRHGMLGVGILKVEPDLISPPERHSCMPLT